MSARMECTILSAESNDGGCIGPLPLAARRATLRGYMGQRQIIEADLAWTASGFDQGVRITVDDHGIIEQVGAAAARPTIRLNNRAILPGMINAHSHAFQRGLRGYGETFPEGKGSFWTWREAMYRLVETMDDGAIHRLSRQAFAEMLAAGVTSVGE